MPETTTTDAAAPSHGAGTKKHWIERNFELVIAVLLGIASIITAWASYQASLYDGEMATANTKAGVLSAEAESQYLEGNQQYTSDGQLFDRLTELGVQERSTDPATVAVASETIELLTFQSMTDTFKAAMEWADAENAADPDTFTHPQASEDYQQELFGTYQETKAQADAQLKRSSDYNNLGDQLSLATVLLAISLFLFGIAALIRGVRIRYIITGVSTVVMVVATVISIVVVTTPLA